MSVYAECLGELARGGVEVWAMPTRPPSRKSWFDAERAARGRRFFLDNLLQCTQCMMESLVCGFSLPNFSRPLLLTDASARPEAAARRYLATFRHLLLWHLFDVQDETGPAHASLRQVNSIHERSRDLVNRDGERFFTQFDMTLVMCGFVGLIVMYPAENGIRCSEAQLADFIHLWRAIGDGLGVAECCNLCCPDDLCTVRLKCKSIERLVLLPAMLRYPREASVLADAFLAGFGPALLPFLHSRNSILVWNFDLCQRYSSQPLGEYRRRFRLTWADAAMLAWKRGFTGLCVHCPPAARLLNGLLLRLVAWAARRRGLLESPAAE